MRRFSKADVRDSDSHQFPWYVLYPESRRSATWVWGEWPSSPLHTRMFDSGIVRGMVCGVELFDLYERVIDSPTYHLDECDLDGAVRILPDEPGRWSFDVNGSGCAVLPWLSSHA